MKISTSNIHFTEQTKTPYTIGIVVGSPAMIKLEDGQWISSEKVPTSLRGEVKLRCGRYLADDFGNTEKETWDYQLLEPLQIVEEEKVKVDAGTASLVAERIKILRDNRFEFHISENPYYQKGEMKIGSVLLIAMRDSEFEAFIESSKLPQYLTKFTGKKKSVEEAAMREYPVSMDDYDGKYEEYDENEIPRNAFIEGAKWQSLQEPKKDSIHTSWDEIISSSGVSGDDYYWNRFIKYLKENFNPPTPKQ